LSVKDIQASTEGFPKISINKVGVRNIDLPIQLYQRDVEDIFNTIATMSSYCDLVEDLKGINMSRIERTLVPIFTQEKGFITDLSRKAVIELKKAHETNHIYLKIKFKYPIQGHSPTTGIYSPESANVEIETKMIDNVITQFLTVETVGMSLCPCSKEMSLLINNLTKEEADYLIPIQDDFPELYEKIARAGFGAHNQKSYVKVTAELNHDEILYIEELASLIDNSTSCPTFSVLKRPDEKFVTEVSYMGGFFDENKLFTEVEGTGPKFVEDIARQAAVRLNEFLSEKKILDYVIVVRNQESIHSNDIEAVAVLNAGKELR